MGLKKTKKRVKYNPRGKSASGSGKCMIKGTREERMWPVARTERNWPSWSPKQEGVSEQWDGTMPSVGTRPGWKSPGKGM